MVADIIASFAIAVLSGMGVGSGGLLVIWLTLISGMPQLAAQGINLMFFLFSSGSALLIHLFKRKILWTAVLLLSVIGIAGALLGSAVAGMLPVGVIRKIFGAMLAASGVYTLLRKKVTGKNLG